MEERDVSYRSLRRCRAAPQSAAADFSSSARRRRRRRRYFDGAPPTRAVLWLIFSATFVVREAAARHADTQKWTCGSRLKRINKSSQKKRTGHNFRPQKCRGNGRLKSNIKARGLLKLFTEIHVGCSSYSNNSARHRIALTDWEEERKKNVFATNNNSIKQKNKETILKLARSRLPEKQKAIYAGCQHC